MKISLAQETDIKAISEIEEREMPVPWSFNSFKEAFEKDYTLFLVSKENDEITGFAVFYLTGIEAELPDIVVSSNYRNQGVGSSLLREGLNMLSSKKITDIYLEVRVSNTPAINLYKKFGFEETGIRKSFYRNPVEDAYCMHLNQLV